jgi:broad specificity phosphatase PhoE
LFWQGSGSYNLSYSLKIKELARNILMGLPLIYLARHGETVWTLSGQHTGHTDIPLTQLGERNAALLGDCLKRLPFVSVYTSPLQRASATCDLAGFASVAQKDPDLMEWQYGDYEGRTTADIQKERPGWNIFRDGCPGGETLDEVAARALRVVTRLKMTKTGNVLLFSHGHFLRFVATSWLGLPAIAARFFLLRPTSLSILGYEHDLDEPVIRLWNDIDHLDT